MWYSIECLKEIFKVDRRSIEKFAELKKINLNSNGQKCSKLKKL
jgi:hypothetical protein